VLFNYVALSLFPSHSGGKKTNDDDDDDDDDEVRVEDTASQNKPSFWHSIWKRNTFPRLVPAFGLLGKAPSETFDL
jgi:hypothetical protein